MRSCDVPTVSQQEVEGEVEEEPREVCGEEGLRVKKKGCKLGLLRVHEESLMSLKRRV